ncbi:unnamed protein product [Effrenium voratum]|nr:unnamed protein product [Effrenium voratum]CAJ1447607.1 unnamed protein product [Effrenium voratum]|mmetsp:Transcript_30060/g.71516  ORF Transcript_30060/g.71516 Transcript_30060/m.71516 type:complete len:103 (-) Transcript_30060:25-333(-)
MLTLLLTAAHVAAVQPQGSATPCQGVRQQLREAEAALQEIQGTRAELQHLDSSAWPKLWSQGAEHAVSAFLQEEEVRLNHIETAAEERQAMLQLQETSACAS